MKHKTSAADSFAETNIVMKESEVNLLFSDAR